MKFVFYDWGGLNVWLFHFINDQRGPLLDNLMLLGTQLGDHSNFLIYFVMATVYGFAACLSRKNRRSLTIQWTFTLIAFVVCYFAVEEAVAGLKILFDYPRPLIALNGAVHVVGTPEIKYSIPSGHTAFAMLLAMSFWNVANRPLRTILVAFVIWVGLSRVSLGAHFPADVLAGCLVSGMTVYMLHKLLRYAFLRCWGTY